MEQIEVEPLVSIITVTRNRDMLISRAVKSVLKQTYRNIDYVIVDGASSDNTEGVIKEFIQNDQRIKLYSA